MADHAHNKRTSFDPRDVARAIATGKPVGVITRGTTNTNRLRRCDRWMIHQPDIARLLRHSDRPLALDVGYGASDTTTREWGRWLRRINPNVEVVGLEINPERIFPATDGVHFEQGGFELAGYTPQLVRAFNVLRQYDVDQVYDAWNLVTSRLAPGGKFIEGTCDELGRRATWVTLTADGPQTLTLAWDPLHTHTPSQLAERLPKVLIHRNIPGERIHQIFYTIDAAWTQTTPWAVYGPRVHWRETLKLLATSYPDLPFITSRRPIRDNVITFPWSAVAPRTLVNNATKH